MKRSTIAAPAPRHISLALFPLCIVPCSAFTASIRAPRLCCGTPGQPAPRKARNARLAGKHVSIASATGQKWKPKPITVAPCRENERADLWVLSVRTEQKNCAENEDRWAQLLPTKTSLHYPFPRFSTTTHTLFSLPNTQTTFVLWSMYY